MRYADVIVIGAGLAGHCAALSAAEKGASVVLLEKMDRYGGSSSLSGGSFAFSGTEAQRAAGIDDSNTLFAEDMIRSSANKADVALVRLYLDHQLETYGWLQKQGVIFHQVSLSSNTSVPRTHPTNPQQCMDALHERVLENSQIVYWNSTAVKRLLVDEGSHRLTGVRIDRGSHASTVLVKGGVVIASGGFSQNRALIAKYAPELADAASFGGAGNVGDGMSMAQGLGADLVDMDYITGTFGMAFNHYPDLITRPNDEPLLRMAVYRGGIVLNLSGRRFADESMSYKTMGTLTLRQPKGIVFQVFDQAIMNQSAPEPTVNDLLGAFEKGAIKRAESIRQLAELVNLDPAAVEGSIHRYNSDVTTLGRDAEFGRRYLGKGWGSLVTIDKPPYYVLPCSTGVTATYCGVRVDASMRVLGVAGSPIVGLYAAGEVTGGFHGSGYVSGTAQGKAAIFGRIAGAHAAVAHRRGQSRVHSY